LVARATALRESAAKPDRHAWAAHPREAVIAYFSAEFGLHERLPIYAGGLGILAGDHLKSASAMGVPLIGVGLFYAQGYHEQRLSPDGSPGEHYVRTDPREMGGEVCTLPGGERLLVHVRMAERDVHMQVWRFKLRELTLLLLDTDIAENTPRDREITQRLYGGDYLVRIEQELALGVGGYFALEALGYKPTVCHMNEGHAGFLSLAELHATMRDHALNIEEAAEVVAAANVFTTHTPIAAGNDVFALETLLPYLRPLCENLGLPLEWVIALGAEPGAAKPLDRFSMTAFALALACGRNGVSLEHGAVSRRLWHGLWPGLVENEVPIGAIVNGVHLPTWTAPEMKRHYQGKVDHAAFTRDKRQLRQRLVSVCQQGGHAQFSADVLTLGFARRFAEYKRALLLFSDPARLKRILFHPQRPMQLVFAGKAHPNNEREKANIKHWHDLVRELGLEARVSFIQNYNMEIARTLVQGVDAWLNTPRPPLEASGTSGMKVLENGALNVSVLDGWWKEAYAPGLGFAVGEPYDAAADNEVAHRDADDADSLYRILEEELAPLFYEPEQVRWIDRCVTSGQVLGPRFSSDRMVEDYVTRYYAPAHRARETLLANEARQARAQASERAALQAAVPEITVQWLSELPPQPAVGARVSVRALIHAADLSLTQVELVVGRTPEQAGTPYDLRDSEVYPCALSAGDAPGQWIASAEFVCHYAGPSACCVRITPRSRDKRMLSLGVWG
jgi:starch phosphorylase